MKRCAPFKVVGVALTFILAGADVLSAQPSTLSYQGRLLDSGTPYSGAADLDFDLYDAAIGGNLVAGPDSHVGVLISDGLFTVQLDFGPPAAVFNGDPRWLEIIVNGTPLSPRQELTAAPYALFSVLPWETSGTDISYSAGRVGIGTSTPMATLEVAGTPGVDGIMFPDGTMQTSAATGGGGFWSPSGTHVFSNNTGNVGIGSASPNHRLRVSGGPAWTSNGWTGSVELDNAAAIAWRSNAAGKRFGIGQSTGGLWFFNSASDPGNAGSPANYNMIISDSGNVGIGVNTPTSRLDIGGLQDGLRITGFQPFLTLRDSNAGNARAVIQNGAGNIRLFTEASLGVGIPPLTVRNDGIDVIGQNAMTCVGFQPFVTLSDSNSGFARGRIQTANGDLNFYTEASIAAGAPALKVFNNGTTSVKVLQVLGADLAEKFPTSDNDAEPGTVMEIDPEKDGQIRICRSAYSRLVAGVVSGAGNLTAGAILGNLPGNEDAPPIALSGRVWVKCDTTEARIDRGDLLTTADAPGYAMKAVDDGRARGAILGKAMTPLAAGETGLVLVLVNLQ